MPFPSAHTVRSSPRRVEPIPLLMSKDELTCPICTADVPMSGDERPGDEVFCTYCGAPLSVSKGSKGEDDLELEEDL